ncbi:hypothetical protein LINPERHAP2_LOCUS26518 [Linum perenne]
MAMKRRLEFLWARTGPIQVSDLANNFFLVRFAQEKDYMTAAFEGPWRIYDFYIAVAKWSPSFNEEEPFQSILTWVRLPRLPIHYFNEVAVKRIGDHIGRTVRMDLATKEGARGRFARVCVEVDITKPLLGKYMIEDKILKIEYESLENLCFDCGMYGHKKEACPSKVVSQDANEADTRELRAEDGSVENEVGEWMTVQRRNRRKATKPAPPAKKIVSSQQGFSILQDDVPEPEVGMQVKDKGADVASSSHTKNFNGIAESLRKVLDDAAGVQSNEDPRRSQAKASSQRQTLKNITNSQPVMAAAKKNVMSDVPIFDLGQENNEQTEQLVTVPVVYHNPAFQAESCTVKAQKPKEVFVRRGVTPKGSTSDPSPFLIGKKKKVVKRDGKVSEKKVTKVITPDVADSSCTATRKPPDRPQ